MEQIPSRPDSSEVDLFRNGKGVINFNAEIPDGALSLVVAEQQLYGSQVAGQAVDQRRLCSSQGMGAEQVRVQPDAGNSLRQKPSVLPRGHALARATRRCEQEFAGLLAGCSDVAEPQPQVPQPKVRPPRTPDDFGEK